LAYEGTSVETQARVTRNVQIQNTGLSATLSALPAGSNATFDQQLQFTVTANTNNISRIELFSTGGSVGVATNQAAAVFQRVRRLYLGLGLHPFYALVTDQAGHRYQTQTVWYRHRSDNHAHADRACRRCWCGRPFVGWQYDVQSTTNL
jgi:hypothetical protein